MAKIATEWRNYDVVVVGSGGAGSHAAQAAAESGAHVLVVSKDPIGCSPGRKGLNRRLEPVITISPHGSGRSAQIITMETMRHRVQISPIARQA